jgi:hypothetical protein
LADLLFEAVMAEAEECLRERAGRALAVLMHVRSQNSRNNEKVEEMNVSGVVKMEEENKTPSVTDHVMDKLTAALLDAINLPGNEPDEETAEVCALLSENPTGLGKPGRKRKGGEAAEKGGLKKVKVVDTNGNDYSSMSLFSFCFFVLFICLVWLFGFDSFSLIDRPCLVAPCAAPLIPRADVAHEFGARIQCEPV